MRETRRRRQCINYVGRRQLRGGKKNSTNRLAVFENVFFSPDVSIGDSNLANGIIKRVRAELYAISAVNFNFFFCPFVLNF